MKVGNIVQLVVSFFFFFFFFFFGTGVSKCNGEIGEGVNDEIRAWNFQLKVHTSDSASVITLK